MNREAVVKLYEDLRGLSAEIVAEGKEHIPMLVPVIDGDPASPIPLHQMPKAMWPALQKQATKMPGHDVYTVLIAESWVSVSSKAPDLKNVVPPSQDPDRREAILFSIVGKNWYAAAMCYIDREKNSLERAPLRFQGDPNWGVLGGNLMPNDETATRH